MILRQLFKYTLLFLITLTVLNPPAMAQQLVFSMNDPVGDDKGPGTYVYPTNPVFVAGAFDLTKFEVYYDNGWVVFKVYLRNLGNNPWNGANGFSLQYIHIYVYTTLDIAPQTDTIGLNIRVDPGWHFAVLLNGGWNPGSGPLPQGEEPTIYYYNGTAITWSDLFRINVDAANNAVVTRIYQSLLLDVEHMGSWGYAVFITSYDGYQPDKVRAFAVQADQWTVGGVDSEALQAGVEPRVLDLLANTSDAQYSMLKTYDPKEGTLATVNMVFPSNPVQVTLTTPTTPLPTTTTSPSPTTTTPTTTTSPSPSLEETTTPTKTQTTTTSPSPTTTPTTSSPIIFAPPVHTRSYTPPGPPEHAFIIIYLALIATAVILIIVLIKLIKT